VQTTDADANKVHKTETFADQEGFGRNAVCFLNSLRYKENTLFVFNSIQTFEILCTHYFIFCVDDFFKQPQF
jgi:hypothetical protein